MRIWEMENTFLQCLMVMEDKKWQSIAKSECTQYVVDHLQFGFGF